MTDHAPATAGQPADQLEGVMPASCVPDNLGALVAQCQLQGWTREQLKLRLQALNYRGKGPGFVASQLRSWARTGPGDQPGVGSGEGGGCRVPGADCRREQCAGLLPGEVLECPYPLLSERRPGESGPAWVARIHQLAQQQSADRAAAVRRSPAARELMQTQLQLDPDSWTGGVPPAWQTAPHGWVPADPVQLRVRQQLLHCVGVALADPDAQS